MDLEKILPELIEIVKSAGKKTLEYYKEDFEGEKKEEFPVTKADLASNTILIERLKRFEGFGLISEEIKTEDVSRLNEKRLFIVDPLDGTKDFVHKTDDYAIMLGLAEDGYPVLGIVYRPLDDTLYSAISGKGAFVERGGNKERISVSKVEDFSDMKLLTSRFHLREPEIRLKDALSIGEFEKRGSGGLKMCAVAEGSAEVYVSTTDKTGEWDTAASVVIVEEAGGIVTDMDGNKLKYNKERPFNLRGFVVSNGVKHGVVISSLKEIMDSVE